MAFSTATKPPFSSKFVLSRVAATHQSLQKDAALEPFVQHTVQVAGSGEIGARELANVVYGAARSGGGKWMDALFMALSRVAEWCVGDFDA